MNIITTLTDRNIIWFSNSHNAVFLIKNFRNISPNTGSNNNLQISLYLILEEEVFFIGKVNNENPNLKTLIYIPINKLKIQNLGLIALSSNSETNVKYKTEILIEYDYEENNEKFTPYRYCYDMDKITKIKEQIESDVKNLIDQTNQINNKNDTNITLSQNKTIEFNNKVSKTFDESSEEELYNDSNDEVVNIKTLMSEKKKKEKMNLVALKNVNSKNNSTLLNKKRNNVHKY